jgi:uncharacterized coiled-coil protein SlyX
MSAVTSGRAERQHRHRGSRCRRRIQYDADRHCEANKDVCHGIRGAATANANAVPVVIDLAGQLGTVSSSRRFQRRDQADEQQQRSLLGLKPVTFHYKSDTQNRPQFGLIAEAVAEVDPNLVVRDEKGEIYTVRYDAVNAMLLNEFLKEHRRVAEQQTKVAEQESTIAELKTSVAQQQKQIEALTATVQKVSDRVAFSKSAPLTLKLLRCLALNLLRAFSSLA